MADQAQEGLLALTSMKPEPPPEECCKSSGVTVNWQLTPCWVTGNVFPAIVSEPDRGAGAVLAPTENPTEPGPAPLAPEVTEIQGVVVEAVQGQLAGEVETFTAKVPPAGG